jgi:hypothetical protein
MPPGFCASAVPLPEIAISNALAAAAAWGVRNIGLASLSYRS